MEIGGTVDEPEQGKSAATTVRERGGASAADARSRVAEDVYPYSDVSGWCRAVADPHLTHHGPPVRVPDSGGRTVWLVTRYDDVRLVLGDRRFGRRPTVGMEPPRASPQRHSRATLLPTTDPPDHARLRRLFNHAFTAASAERRRPLVRQLLDRYLDPLAAAGPPADLVGDVFDPFTLEVVANLLGVPAADRQRLLVWTSVFHDAAPSAEEFNGHIEAVGRYFDDLVESRRRRPANDIISEALRIRDQHAVNTTDADVASMCTGLFSSGVFVLRSQLQISTHALLSHPDEMARLREQPSILAHAVNELLRYAPLRIGPLKPSYVLEDVEVGGQIMRQGDLVVPMPAAANLDEDVFADPYRLDLRRELDSSTERLPTLAFGFGAHFCQAAQFARMVIGTVVWRLVERFPDLHIAVPNEHLRWSQGRRLRSFDELPISW